MECDRRQFESAVSYASLEPAISFLPQFTNLNKSRYQDYILVKVRLTPVEPLRRADNDLSLSPQVFYEDIFMKEHIQERALDATTILSNIGGNTGMFLGMSVITLAEIFVFFVKWLWASLDLSRRNKIHRKLEEQRHSSEKPLLP